VAKGLEVVEEEGEEVNLPHSSLAGVVGVVVVAASLVALDYSEVLY
jgi:hypothetical protein